MGNIVGVVIVSILVVIRLLVVRVVIEAVNRVQRVGILVSISKEGSSKFEVRDVIHLLVMEDLFFLLTQVTILHGSEVDMTLALSSRSSSASSKSSIKENIVLLLLVMIVASASHHITHMVVVSSEQITVIEVKVQIIIVVIIGGACAVLGSFAISIGILAIVGGRE